VLAVSGLRVRHPRYGEGEVQKERHKGFELLVLFPQGKKIWVRRDDLVISEPEPQARPAPPKVAKPAKDVKPEDRTRLEARRLIEALRLGTVPPDLVEKFTYGRQEEIARFGRWLDEPETPVYLVVGEPGAGKTQLLSYFYWLGLKQRFAVALAEVDPLERPLHKPKNVYAGFVSTFRWRDGDKDRGFRDFLKLADQRGLLEEHRYFCHVRGLEDEEGFWHWLEGSSGASLPLDPEGMKVKESAGGFIPAMYWDAASANIYVYLLSGLGWIAGKLGLRGLLLLLDELELLDTVTAVRQGKGWSFLDGLVLAALNCTSLTLCERWPAELNDAVLLYSKRVLLYRGAVRMPVPYLFKLPSNLKIVMATTPGSEVAVRYETKPQRQALAIRVTLDPLSQTELEGLGRSILEWYARAYDSRSIRGVRPEDVMSVVGNQLSGYDRVRRFVKGVVEFLDIRSFA